MSENTNKAPEDAVTKAVIYTDGGANPNPGPAGWGIHGYFFSDKKPTQGSGCKKGLPSKDGYLKDKKQKERAVDCQLYVDGWGSFNQKQSNNYAELTAFVRALETVSEKVGGLTDVLMLIDSKYVIKGASEWLSRWKKNDWTKGDGEPISNKDLWVKVDALLEKAKEKDVNLTFKWVKGHSDDVGNDIVDNYAGWGVRCSSKGIEVDQIEFSEAKGYWTPKADLNRMLSQSHWYFNTHAIKDNVDSKGRHLYHLGTQGKDNDLGHTATSAYYSVVAVKEPVDILTDMQQLHDKLDKRKLGQVVVGRLDNILRPVILERLNQNFNAHTLPVKRGHRVEAASGETLTVVQHPPGLAFRAVENLSLLEELLDSYTRGDTKNICLTDITELIYYHDDKDKKKPWKIRKDMTSQTVSVTADVNYDTRKTKGSQKTLLKLGADLPKRNMLAAIAERNPKVYAITWRESDGAFRVATVVEAGDDVGIWASVYSNLRLLDNKPSK